MLVAQLSDTHILDRDPEHPAAELRSANLRDAVAAVNAAQPDLVIFTGDTTQHGATGEYARLRALLAPLAAPLYVVPGNRDDKNAMSHAFGDCRWMPDGSEFLHYVVEDHGVRLVGLDSTLAGERKGRFCAARQAWLEGVLAAQPERPTLLFIHHPPFDVDEHYVGGYRRPEEAAALTAIVSRHPQVVAFICGHVHWPVEREWAGTQARIMPSVAVDLRNGVDEDTAAGRPVYSLHRLGADGSVCSELHLAATLG